MSIPCSSQASNQFLTRRANLASTLSLFFCNSCSMSLEKKHLTMRILCLSSLSSSIDLGRTPLTNTNKGCLGAKVITMFTYLALHVGESMTWIYAPVLMLFPILTVFRIRVTSVIKVVTVILVHPDFHWKCSLI